MSPPFPEPRRRAAGGSLGNAVHGDPAPVTENRAGKDGNAADGR